MKTPLIVALILLAALVTYGWLHSVPHDGDSGKPPSGEVSANYDPRHDRIRTNAPLASGTDVRGIPMIPAGSTGADGKGRIFEPVGEAASSRGPEITELIKKAQHRDEQKDLDGAIQLYEEARSKEPHNIEVLERLSFDLISRRGKGDLDRARAIAQSLTEVAPGNWMGWYNVACCEALLGQHEAALAALSHAMEANPTKVRESVQADRDLDSIRELPEFRRILNPK